MTDIIDLARAAGVRPLSYSEEYIGGLERLVAAAEAAEREAIARIFDGPVWSYDYREIAAAIRARSKE